MSVASTPVIDPVALTRDLIRRPSVTPADEGAMDVLERALTALGFHCRRMPFENIENLYARRGTAAPNLCFAGHTDVVPTGSTEASGTATGAATGSDTASGAGSATGSDSGSATASGAGSATGSDSGSGAASGMLGGEITITVASSPKGAFVTFGDETRPRGKTPLSFTVPAADTEVDIDIELPGYVDEERTVKLTGNVDLEVALKKKSRGDSSGSSRGSGRGTSRGSGGGSSRGTGGTTGDDVMDPFK